MLVFSQPWILWLLPLPLLVRLLLPAGQLQQQRALKVPFFTRLKNLKGATTTLTRKPWRFLLACIIWTLLVLAAANPQWVGAPIALERNGRNIMLALDISGSMELTDMDWHGKTVSRIAVVKAVAKKFIESRVGDRLGLILFGSEAYLQTPLTFDRDTVMAMLDDATVGLAGRRTAIGDAIGLAIKRMAHFGKQQKVLILLTDGMNNTGHVEPVKAAEVAKNHGMRIYTVGLGSNQIVMPGLFGPQVVATNSELDEQMLRNISESTGGKYFRAKTTAELQAVYSMLDQLEPVEADQATYRPRDSLYYYLLGLAMLLSIGLWWPRSWRMARSAA